MVSARDCSNACMLSVPDSVPRHPHRRCYWFTLCLLHSGSWDSCTLWNALCILLYWCAHVRDLQLHLTEQQGWLELLVISTMKVIDEDRLANVQAHGINRFGLSRSGAVATQELANTPVWIRNDRWAAGLCTYYSACVLFVDVEPYRQCLHVVCGCRAVQTYSAETSLALLAIYPLSKYIQLRLTPNISWMH